ncbi:MAG: uroporphyrinogen decarboxylase family protein [Caldicoprobacterales bacterium]|jgi:uroporphyrinogen decarboxylase
MTERENYLHTVKFGNPRWIPAYIAVNLASLIEYKDEMEKVMVRYPQYFGHFIPGQTDYSQYGDGNCDIKEKDAWGYTWHYTKYGIEGCVTEHPLADWSALESYQPPDANLVHDRGGSRNWEAELKEIERKRQQGELTSGYLVHGFLFLRLQYLRGFENLMYDMADEHPNLYKLIEIIDHHTLTIVKKYCSTGVDLMEFPEDLGAEKSMLISRKMFRQYIKPSYRKYIEPCKENDVITAFHSDGYILDILDDLLDLRLDVINPQDLCNGIDNLAKALKGKACIRLDIDRSKITPYGTRAEIFELIEKEVKVLGSKHGGLEFIYGVYPPTTPDRVNYVCEALDKYRTYWWDK